MPRPARIHADKTPIRTHYIAEWAEKYELTQADIVRELGVDKSTVSRWFAGMVPSERHLVPLVALFQLDEVAALFRHPDDDWLARFFRNREAEERERMVNMLKAGFGREERKSKTGT